MAITPIAGTDVSRGLDGSGNGFEVRPVIAISGVHDSDGASFNPDGLPQILAYTDGVLQSVSVTDGTDTWVQTFTYTSGNLTGVSAWVKQ